MNMPGDAAAPEALVARYVYCVLPGEVGDWTLHGLNERPVRAICAAGLTALTQSSPRRALCGRRRTCQGVGACRRRRG